MALIPAGANAPGYSNLACGLGASLKRLVVEKLPSGQGFDLAVRDGNTGFTFFNVEGHEYDYDPRCEVAYHHEWQACSFQRSLPTRSAVHRTPAAMVGKISVGAAMQAIEIDRLANGQTTSMVMPPIQHAIGPDTPDLVHGPDVIVGQIEDVAQLGRVGTQFNFAVGTDSCNNGDTPIDWFALPNTDHPVVPQNLYRMSGGADDTERFEQIGQSWVKHTFFALEDGVCGTCMTGGCSTRRPSLPRLLRPVRRRASMATKTASVHAPGSILSRSIPFECKRSQRPRAQSRRRTGSW